MAFALVLRALWWLLQVNSKPWVRLRLRCEIFAQALLADNAHNSWKGVQGPPTHCTDMVLPRIWHTD